MRILEYVQVCWVLILNSLIQRRLQNITVGCFQIGVVTAIKWKRLKLTPLNYLGIAVKLSRTEYALRVFKLGVTIFERNTEGSTEITNLKRFSYYYNGKQEVDRGVITYHEALVALVSTKSYDTSVKNIYVYKRLVNNKYIKSRFNEIRRLTVETIPISYAVVVCDNTTRSVVFADTSGDFLAYTDPFRERRSIASTIKTPLYALSIELFKSPLTTQYNDQQCPIEWNGETIIPRNSDNKFRGMVNMEYAFANSINTIAVSVINNIGVNRFASFISEVVRFFGQRFGFG